MPTRRPAPRHKASRSLQHTVGRIAADTASTFPTSAVVTVVALVGVAGVAVGVGVLDGSAEPTARSVAESTPGTEQLVVGEALDARAEATGDAAEATGDAGATSRSQTRPVLAAAERADKAAAMPVASQSVSRGGTRTVAASDPRDIAMQMLPEFGWSADQFSCLDQLYLHESGWDPLASNPSSGAHGIPQALPGEKMAVAGVDWRTNPATQLEWGLPYIRDSYGTPCGAWAFWQSNSWY